MVTIISDDGAGGAGRRRAQPAAGGSPGPCANLRWTEMGGAPLARAPGTRELARRSRTGRCRAGVLGVLEQKHP